MLLRPVRDTEEDAEAVRQLAEASFAVFAEPPAAHHAAHHTGHRSGPGGPSPEGPRAIAPGQVLPAVRPGPPPGPGDGSDSEDVRQRERSRERVRHLARTDTGGGWIAADAGGRPVGAAQSLIREGTWALALLAVLPEAQGKGVGTALMQRTMQYGRACLRGMVCCTANPVAARTYRKAGFDLHPAMCLRGAVDRARLAPPDGAVVVGSAAQRDLMDSVDRRLRSGAHGPDHEFLVRHHRLFVSDDFTGSGYCYLRESGEVELLAATSRRLATRLLTAALMSLPEGGRATVRTVTADQQWALDVGLAAGLEVSTAGYLCVRGMRPPTPYIPSGGFL
ncbi:GNAT family N-acetyltransferase [Streptomyces nanshensis]|uniref:GCN5 family acetyltransferase n=1 Tax=Streptomyces nanshensis TaxID=518642 RepID=A0A1E7L133_9ACTN|nr:GNAT family N-acetyltransferase [Streptomyces nanshensis]OEV09886.1 GCN5 family acetyltransferase [Streptomyces nanshensis]